MPETTRSVPISEDGSEHIVHLMDNDQYWAIQGALAANRPLLVRGEPGLGKTQLAYAAAALLERPIIHFTIDSTTESRDLLWTFDAVQRLADAQVASHLYSDRDQLRAEIAVSKYVEPGPLWWSIHWESAFEIDPCAAPPQPKGWNKDKGIVILIDEIDKAESNVPNGLLEVLGSRQFKPDGWSQPIRSESESDSPLIVITTNEERALPDAFIRRCYVLQLQLPQCVNPDGSDLDDAAHSEFIDYFVSLGKAHFAESIPLKQLQEAAEMLYADRKRAVLNSLTPKPGPAEFLDFLRAMIKLANARLGSRKNSQQKIAAAYEEIGKSIRRFVFNKSSGTES